MPTPHNKKDKKSDKTMYNAYRFTKSSRFLMIALDHRGSFERLACLRMHTTDKQFLITLKSELIGAMHNASSGLLLDPLYGLPAYKQFLTTAYKKPKPFLLCIEESGYENKDEDRTTKLQYTVDDLHTMGASGIKILLYINPHAPSVMKQLFTVKHVLTDCKRANLPLFLEIVTYKRQQENISKSSLILASLALFLEHNIIPDVFKLEFSGDAESCRKITNRLTTIPWTLLTFGDPYERFRDNLRIAIENGASGFLAGRSIWRELPVTDVKKRKIFLETIVKKRFEEIATITLKPPLCL